MDTKENIQAINVRYSKLAGDNCCLSCGSAINFAEPKPGEVCVDLGSGRGQDVLRMANEVGSEGISYGIDISDGMIAKAEGYARKMGIENAKFIQSELGSIPLDSDSVDLLISNCTINHADDKQAVWNEVFRVLKPGGRFVVSDIYSTEPVPEKVCHRSGSYSRMLGRFRYTGSVYAAAVTGRFSGCYYLRRKYSLCEGRSRSCKLYTFGI